MSIVQKFMGLTFLILILALFLRRASAARSLAAGLSSAYVGAVNALGKL